MKVFEQPLALPGSAKNLPDMNPKLSQKYPRFVLDISKIGLRYVSEMSQVSLRNFPELFDKSPRYVCPRLVTDMSKKCS